MLPLSVEVENLTDTDDDRMLRELYRLIRQLNTVEKAIILLYLEDKPYEEIASLIGITKSNVGVKISRIKEKMILSRARSGFEKLVRYERFFFFFSLFAMAYMALPPLTMIFGLPTVIILEITMLYCAGEQAYKVYLLRKIHMDTDNVQELIGKMLAYRSLTMLTFKIGMFVLLPIILVAMFLPLFNQPDKLYLLAGAVVGAVIGFVLGLSAFRRHKKDIENVIGELNELESYLNEQ